MSAVTLTREATTRFGEAATSLARPVPAVGSAGSLTANAPSIHVPMRFMLTGLLALAAGCAVLIIRPDILASYHYNQYVISTTHLFVLGWICTIVMGAMYQLVPVALETHLYSERLAKWQFLLHTIGFVGMVYMFWRWDMKQVGHFGSALAVGAGLFVYNIVRTLMKVPRWNTIATAIACVLGWLCLTMLAGLVIAAGKCTYESAATLAPGNALGEVIRGLQSAAKFVARFDQIGAMHAHAHLGAVGIFVLLIVGVSYKLVPMFTLSELQSRLRAAVSVALINLGLLGTFFSILLRSSWKPVFATIIVAGLVVYAVEIRAVLRARKRRALDWGLRSFLTALWLLLPLSLLGLVLSWPTLPLNATTGQLENLYGYLAIIGVISFAIIGMLYKILPFLVWFGSYSKHIGARKVPSLGDLYSTRVQAAGYWLYVMALTGTGTGIVLSHTLLTRIGCSLLAVAVAALLWNVGMMLRHLFRPQLQPLNAHPVKS